MNLLSAGYEQIRVLMQGMTASQRLALFAVPILVVGAFGYLLISSRDASQTAVSFGKVFTTDELRSAEQAFVDAGLTDFETRGQRIYVGRDEVEQYNAALLAGGALPENWAAEWESHFRESNLFTSERQLQTMREIALAKELRRMIRAVPDISEASVTWARPRNGSRWNLRNSKVTATVAVTPRQGKTVTSELVSSLRQAVATMVPDLAPDRVTIFDQSTGRSHAPVDPDMADDHRAIDLVRKYTQMHQSRIEDHLAYIPGKVVSVQLELDELGRKVERVQEVDSKKTVSLTQTQSSRSRQTRKDAPRAEPGQQSNGSRSLRVAAGGDQSETLEESDQSSTVAPSFRIAEQEYLSAMPKAVRVSVAIPHAYFDAVASEQGLTKGEDDAAQAEYDKQLADIKTQVEADVTAQVLNLLPTGTPADAVDVRSYREVSADSLLPETTFSDTLQGYFDQWGGLIGMTLVSAFALYFVYRSVPTEQEEELPLPQFASATGQSSAKDKAEPEETKRDRVQTAVRDNPAIAASVISRWMDPEA